MRAPLLVSLLVVLGSRPARAESDLQLWLEAGVAYKPFKRFELSFEQHLRFDRDVSRVQAIMPDLGLTYKLHKFLRVGIGYRLQYERNKDGVMELRDRGHVDVRPRYKAGPIELSYRLRFQEEVRGSFAAEDLRHTLRNRIAIELLATKPFKPGIAAETFHRLGDGDPIHLHKIRLTASVSYEISHHTIELSYRVEVAQYDPTDPIPHIIGLGYRFDVPRGSSSDEKTPETTPATTPETTSE